jgi:hypothetical protein
VFECGFAKRGTMSLQGGAVLQQVEGGEGVEGGRWMHVIVMARAGCLGG